MGNQQARLTTQDLLQIPEMDNYFVDLVGNIYSTVKSIEPKKLKPYQHFGRRRKPYIRVSLKHKHYLLHRLIASTKVGRKLYKHEVVNHIDGDTSNNALSNLEVVSQHENVQHAVANNLYCSGDAWYVARGITRKAVRPKD